MLNFLVVLQNKKTKQNKKSPQKRLYCVALRKTNKTNKQNVKLQDLAENYQLHFNLPVSLKFVFKFSHYIHTTQPTRQLNHQF